MTPDNENNKENKGKPYLQFTEANFDFEMEFNICGRSFCLSYLYSILVP